MKRKLKRRTKTSNPYRDLYDESKLRPIEVVLKLISKCDDPVLFKQLRYEKRLIFLNWFWTDAIDFETFSKLIKGEITLLDF